jgi:Secretion system C-terminal sorting domain
LRFSNLPQDVTSGEPIPSRSELFQNYPNPFNPKTEIRMQIVESGHVTLRISDLLGRQIAVLLDERKAPGSHSVQWDASDFPSGVYFYTLSVQGEQSHFTETRRLVLLK